jgi:hypothetical protein
MARKAGRKKANANNDGSGCLIVCLAVAGLLFLLPFLLLSVFSFYALKRQYLESADVQQIVDIRRIFPTLGEECAVFGIGAIIFYMCFQGEVSSPVICIGIMISIIIFTIGYYLARHLAVLYFGIVADRDKDILVFPYDMQSYTLTDYFSLRFLKDYCNVDTVALSAITKITRGYGTELYVHGPFGSRRIIMSTKQKRDECLAMIQLFTGKKGMLISEIEVY